ncbi:MAG TPA: hypothetical protein PKK23_20645 [Nitrospirales bacterium]|nr:hypothetical protein [Nitrospiraceae bacterium]HNP31469.1 hypothetical protein [Nitrospirales bacterium]
MIDYNSIRKITNRVIGLFIFLLVMPLMGICTLLIWGFGDGVVFERKKSPTIGTELLFFRIANNDVKNIFQKLGWLSLPHIWQVVTGELVLIIPTLQRKPQYRSYSQNPDGWLRTGSFLIPRQYREPMLGDLLEDREQMRVTGKHFVWIELATFFQLLFACASRPKIWISGLVGWFARSFLS